MPHGLADTSVFQNISLALYVKLSGGKDLHQSTRNDQLVQQFISVRRAILPSYCKQSIAKEQDPLVSIDIAKLSILEVVSNEPKPNNRLDLQETA